MVKRITFILLALIALLSSFPVFAQQRKGSLTGPDGELEYSDGTKVREQYFVDNVLLLDPIEGIWKSEVITRGWNNYRRFPDTKIAEGYCVVIKQGSKFVVYQGDDSFQKIGKNTYRIQHYVVGPNGKQMMSNTFRLTDYSAFSVTVDLPIAADYVGSQGQHIITYSKVRPTMDDYYKAYDAAMAEAEAARKKAEEPTEWSGTGFALNNGHIVTNYHVVKGAKSIMVYGVNGQMNNGLRADVVASDKTNDLAIIKISDNSFNGFGTIPYAVKNRTLDVGEDVWVLGYPLTQYLGNEIKLTKGLISSKSGYQGDVATYQISAPVQPGNSGGPMFDSKGNVVGIVNAGVPGAENVGYSIKTSYLFNLADSYSIASSLPSSNTISSLSLTDQVKRVKAYVFLLMCSANANATSIRSGSSSSSGSLYVSSVGSSSSSSSSSGYTGSTSSTTGVSTSSNTSGDSTRMCRQSVAD